MLESGEFRASLVARAMERIQGTRDDVVVLVYSCRSKNEIQIAHSCLVQATIRDAGCLLHLRIQGADGMPFHSKTRLRRVDAVKPSAAAVGRQPKKQISSKRLGVRRWLECKRQKQFEGPRGQKRALTTKQRSLESSHRSSFVWTFCLQEAINLSAPTDLTPRAN